MPMIGKRKSSGERWFFLLLPRWGTTESMTTSHRDRQVMAMLQTSHGRDAFKSVVPRLRSSMSKFKLIMLHLGPGTHKKVGFVRRNRAEASFEASRLRPGSNHKVKPRVEMSWAGPRIKPSRVFVFCVFLRPLNYLLNWPGYELIVLCMGIGGGWDRPPPEPGRGRGG